jgi:hypothetical protein
MHFLNGRLMSITIDDDAPNRKLDGLIGMQVHVGPPMKVEYRNIRLKRWYETPNFNSMDLLAGGGGKR